ncbi:hypothetical protein QN277_009800 [Acacia crassicarpa]|uniref:Uncharacterized protein n=1 Tax=Acacia crassicarpa TaxID=499986 RepID=A0AAE1IRX5_9FABA|nr:hypothetical protein QN277_009800 [Acacia crassicarpa]
MLTRSGSICRRLRASISRWLQLLINKFVEYDTILMNSLLTSSGQGYFYNNQTEKIYILSYVQAPPEGPARFGGMLTYLSATSWSISRREGLP